MLCSTDRERGCRALQLLHSVANQAPHPNSTIVMCGIAKIFVGQLVEAGARCGSSPSIPPQPYPSSCMSGFACLRQHFTVPLRIPVLRCPGCAARALANEQGDEGPLRPAHIHAAYQQLGGKGKIPQRTSGRHRRL